jgi:hypothetical protein
MIQVVQAFDRAPITEIATDDAPRWSQAQRRRARLPDRDGWLKPHQRMAILRRLAADGRASATISPCRSRAKAASRCPTPSSRPPAPSTACTTPPTNCATLPAARSRWACRRRPIDRWAFTTKEPIGIVAAISAFNHPLNLIVHQVAPADRGGLPGHHQAGGTTPLSCLELRRAGPRGRPAGALVPDLRAGRQRAGRGAGDRSARRLPQLHRLGQGRLVPAQQAAHGARSALEHGGAAPAIVDRSADLGKIIEPIVKGGYYHAGQVCVSTQRIFVHDAIADDFTERSSRGSKRCAPATPP